MLAVIFRDGQKFDAFWTTISGDDEKTTDLHRPLRLVDASDDLFSLKPGQTWVHIVILAHTHSPVFGHLFLLFTRI